METTSDLRLRSWPPQRPSPRHRVCSPQEDNKNSRRAARARGIKDLMRFTDMGIACLSSSFGPSRRTTPTPLADRPRSRRPLWHRSIPNRCLFIACCRAGAYIAITIAPVSPSRNAPSRWRRSRTCVRNRTSASRTVGAPYPRARGLRARHKTSSGGNAALSRKLLRMCDVNSWITARSSRSRSQALNGSHPLMRSSLAGVRFQNGPVQVFFRREMAERIPSLTPQAAAISRIRVPLNPCCENISIAFAISCERRSSEESRLRAKTGVAAAGEGEGKSTSSEYLLNYRPGRRASSNTENVARLP